MTNTLSEMTADTENTQYWTQHNVTLHTQFESRQDSLEYFHWRNAQYLFYEDLMPCSGFDDKVILDYGCGPGNDLVGFLEFSNPKHVIGMDISPTSLAESAHRLRLHSGAHKVSLKLVQDGSPQLPIESESVDYIHSSGVLMITPNMNEILSEFNRILKPDGICKVMIYNYDSLWLHLYVAYQRQILEGIDSDRPLLEAFRRSTDGEDCPISRCYKPSDFIRICSRFGLDAKFVGTAISAFEMTLLPQRYPAIMNRNLDREHRDFLMSLTFDEFGRPHYQGFPAGIDAVYEMTKSA